MLNKTNKNKITLPCTHLKYPRLKTIVVERGKATLSLELKWVFFSTLSLRQISWNIVKERYAIQTREIITSD